MTEAIVAGIITAIITSSGLALVGWFSFKGIRGQTEQIGETAKQESLSVAEQKFRDDLITVVNSYREEVKDLQKEIKKLSDINLKLGETNGELQGQNYKLNCKLDELTAALNKFTCDSSSITSTSTTITHQE